MARISSVAPPWLSRPSPGFNLFDGGPQRAPSLNTTQYGPSRYHGPNRLIAKRGTQIFAIVNDQIRWADLRFLRDEYDLYEQDKAQRSRSSRPGTEDRASSAQDDLFRGTNTKYRVLETRITQIRQLIPSPHGDFMAILTSHTVHIAILPDSSHLNQNDHGPIRLKTHQLGPTIHVLPQAPVMSALWHPLGVSGNTLVTVTADAAVRVWELNQESKWSYESPTLAIDLKKLVDGTSSDQDFEPDAFGIKKGFSPDSVDMEVAAASFGGMGFDEEDGWAPMTLWIAMRGGDLYALCPLLPSKWQPTATIIPSLSTTVVSAAAAMRDDPSTTEVERKICDQQYKWFAAIDSQEPTSAFLDDSQTRGPDVYDRPSQIGPIPKLQGPFLFERPEGSRISDGQRLDDETDITDVFVIAAKIDAEELVGDDEDEYAEIDSLSAPGVSATLICLVTEAGCVYVLLDLDGISGQWLPKLRNKRFTIPSITVSDLTCVAVRGPFDIDPGQEATNWPTFTPDAKSRYDFFLTSSTTVTSFSVLSWAVRLENELTSTTSGLALRIKVLCGPESNAVESRNILSTNDQVTEAEHQAEEGRHLNACLTYFDERIGWYLVLTSNKFRPCAALLEIPNPGKRPSLSRAQTPERISQARSPSPLQILPRPRSPYQPADPFYLITALVGFTEMQVKARHRPALKQEIRLSPTTLEIMSNAHRLLSEETNKIEAAAADLFRRCERLKQEMRDQVLKLRETADKVSHLIDENSSDDNDEPDTDRVSARIEKATERQDELVERFGRLRKRLDNNGGRELTDKEKVWRAEILKLKSPVLKEEWEARKDEDGEKNFKGRKAHGRTRSDEELLWRRLEMAKEMARDLVSEAKAANQSASKPPSRDSIKSPPRPTSKSSNQGLSRIPSKIQKARISEAMSMVDRETDIINALTARLNRLSAGTT